MDEMSFVQHAVLPAMIRGPAMRQKVQVIIHNYEQDSRKNCPELVKRPRSSRLLARQQSGLASRAWLVKRQAEEVRDTH